MSANDALLQESQVIEKLYDGEAMIDINQTVANGFIVLLGGMDHKQRKGNSDLSLAFLALTQGNIVDACFGVAHPSRREDTPASRAARKAKDMLDTSATTDKFRLTAVQTYCEAFQAVVLYREKYDRLNCITRCFKSKKLREKTEMKLRETFLNLAKAVAESR